MCLGPIYTIELTENDMKKMLKYVCWIKLSGPEAAFTIWQADSLLGPYSMVENLHNPAGHKVGDFDMVCDKGLQYYFEGREEEFIRKEKDRIMVLACVRFLHLVAVMDIGKPELKQTRVNRALEHLKELQGKVDTLETRF